MSSAGSVPKSAPALGVYGPRPYESDGGFSAQGLFLTTGVGVAVAVAAGVLAAIVGQFFYMVFVFPLLIGAAVGGAQVWAIRHSKIRTPIACGAAGLIAGVVAVTTVHYVDYINFGRTVDEIALEESLFKDALEQEADPQEREYLKQELAEFEADPEILAIRQVSSFAGYLDWSARQGVEIGSIRGGSKPLNLGRTGSYIYWGVEALIVALISAAMARSRASEPFCVACDAWKTPRELGWLRAKTRSVTEIVQSGRLAELRDIVTDSGDEVGVSVYECPTCSNEDTVVLQVDSITYNNGSRVKSQAARAVYPRGAVEELERYFASFEEMPLCKDLNPEVVRQLKKAAEGRETGELVAKG